MSILPCPVQFKRKGIKMHKEKDYNNHKRKFMDSINKEYHAFKNSMLLKKPQEIYDSYGEIYFYECMYEYFQYNENIDSRFINTAYDVKNKKTVVFLFWKFGNLEMKEEEKQAGE